MASKKIYSVHDAASKATHLVRAVSRNAAVRHITTPQFTVDLADQDTLVRLLGQGVAVVEAVAEADEAE